MEREKGDNGGRRNERKWENKNKNKKEEKKTGKIRAEKRRKFQLLEFTDLLRRPTLISLSSLVARLRPKYFLRLQPLQSFPDYAKYQMQTNNKHGAWLLCCFFIMCMHVPQTLWTHVWGYRHTHTPEHKRWREMYIVLIWIFPDCISNWESLV